MGVSDDRRLYAVLLDRSVGELEAGYGTHVRDRAFQLWWLFAEPAGHCGLKYAAGNLPGALLIPYYTLVQGSGWDMKSTASRTPLSRDDDYVTHRPSHELCKLGAPSRRSVESHRKASMEKELRYLLNEHWRAFEKKNGSSKGHARLSK
jgi:hypothetical protein